MGSESWFDSGVLVGLTIIAMFVILFIALIYFIYMFFTSKSACTRLCDSINMRLDAFDPDACICMKMEECLDGYCKKGERITYIKK